jgi:GNAT superfamily N-acetyltransferase
LHWAERFDLSTWGFIGAYVNNSRIGGAVTAFNTAAIKMLAGRTDIALLWDIRVQPDMRLRRVGSNLLIAVEQWAAAKRCQQVKVETQNINVAACRFYVRHGYAL